MKFIIGNEFCDIMTMHKCLLSLVWLNYVWLGV